MLKSIPAHILPKLNGAYIVGGSVRDLLLGHPPADYDLAVLGRPESFSARLAAEVGGRVVRLGRPGEYLYRIVSSRMTIDLTAAKGDTIEADLGLRDFTVNAMAYDLCADRLIDPRGGRRDLCRKIIRMVSDSGFCSDPVRLLRAYRLAAALAFDIDPDTERAIRRDAPRIRETAGERIRDELLRLFGTPDASAYVSRMVETGLLFSVVPELRDLKGCLQNARHEFDALEHTLQAFYHLEQLLNSPEAVFPDHGEKLRRRLSGGRDALIKCAILFHDIGKPSVRTEDAQHRVHFYRHEKKGAETAEKICKRLRFSNRETDLIKTVISFHLRPLFLFQADKKNRLTRRAATRFFMASRDCTPWVLLHAAADFRAKTAFPHHPFDAFVRRLMTRYWSDFQPNQTLPSLIDGRDLIHRFSLPPSPRFKRILSRIEAARLTGRISTRKEALAMVEKILRRAP